MPIPHTMDDLLAQVRSTIDECAKAVTRLQAELSEQAAEDACLACRRAAQLFFFARTDLGEDLNTLATPLAASLRATREAMERILQKQDSPDVKGYISNVIMRQTLVEALMANDSAAVKRLFKRELAGAR